MLQVKKSELIDGKDTARPTVRTARHIPVRSRDGKKGAGRGRSLLSSYLFLVLLVLTVLVLILPAQLSAQTFLHTPGSNGCTTTTGSNQATHTVSCNVDTNGDPTTFEGTWSFTATANRTYDITRFNPDSGFIGFHFDPTGVSNANFTFTSSSFNVVMNDTDLIYKLQIRGNGGFNNTASAFDSYSIDWDWPAGDTGELPVVNDPDGELNTVVVGKPTTFEQNGIIQNLNLDWSVDVPVGAINLNLAAVAGNAREAFGFGTALETQRLDIVKSISNAGNLQPGDEAFFDIQISNIGGPSALTNLVIPDILPTGLEFVSNEILVGGVVGGNFTSDATCANPQFPGSAMYPSPSGGSYDDATGNWNVGKLCVGDSATLRIHFRAVEFPGLSIDSANPSIVTNTVDTGSITSDQTINNITGTFSADASLFGTAGLEVIKSDVTATTPTAAGDIVDWSITVENIGDVTIGNIEVADTLTHAGANSITSTTDAAIASFAGTSWTLVDPIAPGDTTTITGSYTLDQADVDAGSISNSATAAGDSTAGSDDVTDISDDDGTNDSDPTVTTFNAAPSLSLSKAFTSNADEDSSGDITLGDTLIYTITATNDGNVSQNNVVVSDPLITPNSETCATLAPGATCVLTGSYSVQQSDMDTGSISNTASTQSDEVTTQVTAGPIVTNTAQIASLAISKLLTSNADEDSSGDVSLGDTLTYTVTATNDGNVTQADVVVSDAMITPNSETCTQTSPGADCVLTGTYVVTQSDVDTGSISNTGSAQSNEVTTAVTDSLVTPTQAASPSLAIAKAVTGNADEDASGDVSVGDTLTYTVTATNDGNITQNGVVVSDALITPSSQTCATLAPSADCVLSGSYQITQADADAGQISNTASVQSDEVTTPAAVGPVTTSVAQNPALSISKSLTSNADEDSSGDISVGDTLTYTVTASNDGDVTLSNMVVSDAKITPSSNSCASVAPAGSCVLTGSYVVTQGDVDAGSISNTGSVTTTEVPGPTTTPPVTTPTQNATPSLALTKILASNADEDNSGDITLGDTLTYTVTATNDGNVTQNNVVVSDPLITPNSQTCATLAPAATCVLTGSYSVQQSDMDAGAISNSASVQSDEVTTPVTAGPVVTNVAQNASLAIAKALTSNADEDGSSDVSVGDTLTYTVTATNNGNITLNNVVVSDAKTTPNSQTCATLAPGADCVLSGTYVVTQAEIDAGSVDNSGSVTSTEVPGPINTPVLNTPTQAGNPSFAIAKAVTANADEDGSGTVTLGDTLTYTVTATNDGNLTLNNVVVSDTLITPNSQTCASVAPGESCMLTGTYQVSLADADAGQISNTASVQATKFSTPVTTSLVTPVLSTPAFTITKDVDTASISAPATLGYTITVTNSGNVSLTTPALTDALSQDGNSLTLTSGPTFTGGDDDSDGEIDPGESWTYAANYAATQANIDDGNDIINIATLDTDQLAPASDSATTTIGAAPALTISKADVTAAVPAQAGDRVDWEITVDNSGNVSLSGVTLTDTLTNGDGAVLALTSGPTLRAATDGDGDGEIDINESWIFDASYILTQADVDSGSVTNAVSVVTNEVAGPTAAPNPPVTTIAGAPSLSIAKVQSGNADEDGSGTITLGDTLTYTITATNSGNTTQNNVVVSDPLITPDSQTCAAVAPGATCTLTGSYQVAVEDADSGQVTNTASAESDEVTTPVTAGPITTNVAQNPALTVIKTDVTPAAPSAAGDTASWEISVANTGNVSLTGVSLNDVLTDGDGSVLALTSGPSLRVTTDGDGDGEIDPGENWIYDASYTLTQSDIDSGSITNSVTVSTTELPGPTPAPNPPVTTINAVPAFTIAKDVDTANITAPATLGYTIAVTNSGNVSLTNPALTDNLTQDGSALVLTSGPALNAGDTDSDGEIDPGETWSYSASYAANQADIDNGNDIINSATFSADQVTAASDNAVTSITINPALSITKSAPFNADEDGSGDISLGDTLTYIVTATNDGNVSLTNVEVTDSKTTPASQSCASVAPGATCVLTGTYTVTQADVDAGSISNSGSITSTEVPGPTTTPPVVTTTTPADSSLTLNKALTSNADEDGSATISLGDTLTYMITATNDGNVTQDNVVVTDSKTTPGSRTCASVAPGATCILTGVYQVSQDDVDTGNISNTGSVTSTLITTPVTTNPVITDIPQSAVLSLAKLLTSNADEDSSGDISLGDTLTYTITATNDGNVTQSNVVVADPKITPDSQICATLAPGATCVLTGTYQVSLADADAGEVSNTASVQSDEITTPIATQPVITAVSTNAALSLVKSSPVNADEDSSGDISVGDTLTYTVTATNDGNVSLTDVVVSDAKIMPSSRTCATIAPGETCVLTGTYSVSQTDVDGGVISNSASVTSVEVPGPTITPPVTTITQEKMPSIALAKILANNADGDGSGDISVGDVLTYRVTATNDGNVTLNDVTVGDQKITPNTENCATLAPGASCVLTGNYTVSQADVDAGSVSNSATVTSPDIADPVTTPPVVTATQKGDPSLALAKQLTSNADEDGSGDISLGDTLTYTVIATNDGNVTLTGVVVSDDKIDPSSISCASLAPAQTCVLTGSYQVTQADIDGGSISNTASVTSTEVPGPTTTPPVVTPTQTGDPSLTLDKVLASNADEDTSGDVSAGDTLTYTVTATNDGNVTLSDVTVLDDKISPDSKTCAALAPGATCVLTGSYTVSQTDIDSGSISNTASATSPSLPQPVTVPPLTTVTQDRDPSLALTKILASNADEDTSGDITLGDTLTYTVTATNDGNVTQHNVLVSDNRITPDSQTCASVAPGAMCVLSGTYRVTLEDADAGEVRNSASAQSDEVATPVTAGPLVTAVESTPMLTLVKSDPVNADEDGSGDISLGDTLTYTITATNEGNASLTGVTITDDKITPSSTSCPALVPAEACVLSGSYQVSQADIDAGSVTNSASVISDDIPDPVTTPPVVTATQPARRALSLDKSLAGNADGDGSGDISLDDLLTYRIAATNNGNVTLNNVVVSDNKTMPSSQTCATLAPGAACVLTGSYQVTLTDTDAGEVRNIANAAADMIADPVRAELILEVARAGSISGIVFNDSNGDQIAQDDEQRLPGWIVEIIREENSQSAASASSSANTGNAEGQAQIIAHTTTNTDGYYEFTGLRLGSYQLRFRNPVNDVLYGDISGLELTGGNLTVDQNLPIDPSGVFYDAVTRAPVQGVVATLVNRDGNPLPDVCFIDISQQNQLSDGSGFYRFDIVPGAASSCPVGETEYRIVFDAPGNFSDNPSTVIAVQDGPLNPPAGVGPFLVALQSTAPAAGEDTTYYLSFVLGSGDRDIINNHIPLDPFSDRGPLMVTKSSIKRSVSVGELVPYTITVRNNENVQRAGVDVIDVIPPGFKYVQGSAVVAGVASEPLQASRELRWEDQIIPANDSVEYSLTMVVGAGVTGGDRVNIGFARASIDGAEVSNRGQAVVSILPSAIFDCAEIIGKVFEDRNGNGYQDDGEPGIANARLATVNGQLITTDQYGRYHITCAAVPDARIGSNYVLKLDKRSLPAGYEVTTENPRAIRLTRGKVSKLNFGVKAAGHVAVDISDASFEAGSDVLRQSVAARLPEVLKGAEANNPIVRIAYQMSEAESVDLAKARTAAASKAILAIFAGNGGTEPIIEVDISRQRPEAPEGDDQ